MGSESIETVRVSRSSSPGKFFPPGFRFHPTDEELVLYYLKRKICRRSLKLDIIGEVDVYKWDPEELPGLSKLKTGDRQWFFFSPRDRKYPNGGRSNRATMHGYWKATGKDRIIKCGSRLAGIKKTLVYYQGRAPSGQRTDWVMHEYTLDEEELKRCQFAQEYYALYKVFKKSGPGPKNGEQYGAPFVEEDWNDDDCLEVDALLMRNINSEKHLQLIPVESAKIIPQEEEPLFTDDIVEFLNNIVDEPDISPPLAEIDHPSVETESQNCLKESSIDQWKVMCSSNEHHDMQPGSEVAQSAQEASEDSSVTNIHEREPKPLVVCEDFLEMDDLIGPQPDESLDRPVAQNMEFAHSDGLAEFEFYHDSSRFYNELLPFECQQIPQAYYMNNLEYGMKNSGFHSHSEGARSEVVNYQLHEENEMSYNLWTHDQGNSDFPTAGATQETISPPSGVVIDENLGKPNSQVNQCPITKEDDGTDSWFSSALWAFVESIPTTPASASESSALVSRAFERMSSFSRGRNVNEAAAGVNSALASRRLERSSRSNRGIIYFSVLAVLFAILWIFLGSSIEFLGRCISC